MKHSRKEERMMVLNMVSEGKISVEDSIKLLESLNAGKCPEESFYTPDPQEFEEKFDKFYRNVDGFSKEVGGKFNEAFKDVEPKLKKATRSMVQKTVMVLEDISKSLNETLENLKEDERAEEFAEDLEEAVEEVATEVVEEVTEAVEEMNDAFAENEDDKPVSN